MKLHSLRLLATLCVTAGSAHQLIAAPAACRAAVVEVEAHAGETLRRPVTSDLEFVLQATAAGWIVHLEPISGPDRNAEMDRAALATPPYQSPNPLALTTDFSFRAQDAIAWNPRHFSWFANPQSYAVAMAQYRKLLAGDSAAQSSLATLVASLPAGELEILDARLVNGIADQAGTASTVASHLESTPHTSIDPTGTATPLGRLEWVRLRLTLALPAGVQPARGVLAGPTPCKS